jgi:hypothetical protein
MVVGSVGHDAELDVAEKELVGDFGGERTLNGDADVGAAAAEFVEDGQQVEAGVFVGGEQETTAVEGLQLFERADGFVADADELFGVVAEKFAGLGEGSVAGGALEEDLAEVGFEFADNLADGRLGAVQAGGGAGEAALLGDGEEGLELK